jgi:hypothetical protein
VWAVSGSWKLVLDCHQVFCFIYGNPHLGFATDGGFDAPLKTKLSAALGFKLDDIQLRPIGWIFTSGDPRRI